MDDIEQIKGRLDNIESVSPLINSLRTIAAGGWRTALRRQASSAAYVNHLANVLAALYAQQSASHFCHPVIRRGTGTFRNAIALVLASEQGLCGAYNDTTLQGADRLVGQLLAQCNQVHVSTLGARAARFFATRNVGIFRHHPMPITRVPPFEVVRALADEYLAAYQAGDCDAVYVIYSPYKPAATQPPVSERWLPVDQELLPIATASFPEPIIESQPQALFEQTIEAWVVARLYAFVMSASASEQSARYRAMENASGNIERMIEELTQAYHSARQNEITMEMLDLVGASGVLAKPAGSEDKNRV